MKQARVWGKLERLFPILSPHPWEGRKPPSHQSSPCCCLSHFTPSCVQSVPWFKVGLINPALTFYGSLYSVNATAKAWRFKTSFSQFKWLMWLIESVWMFINLVAKQLAQRSVCHVRRLRSLGGRLRSHLLTTGPTFCVWNQWDQSASFSQVLTGGGNDVQTLKGGGYLTSPEQTCNVQGRDETMLFFFSCKPASFLRVGSEMAFRQSKLDVLLVVAAVCVFHVPNGQSLVISPHCFCFLFFSPVFLLFGPSANTGMEFWCVFVSEEKQRGEMGYYRNFLSLVGSHLIQRAHWGERTLGSHFVYG